MYGRAPYASVAYAQFEAIAPVSAFILMPQIVTILLIGILLI
jgi:hypothetical protein